MEIKHEADVMQVYLQSQTCCSAKCKLNEVKAQLSEQLTIDLGDQFMGSNSIVYSRPHVPKGTTSSIRAMPENEEPPAKLVG